MDEKLWHRHKWPEGMPYELEYPVMPLQQVLEDAAREWPASPFILFDDTVLTYRQIDQAANRVAHFLIASGIQKGDRVAVGATPRPGARLFNKERLG